MKLRAVLSVLVAMCLFAAHVLAADKPNIVLFISDDFSWHDSGAFGSTDAQTPRLDALAKESLRFERAFAASPTCTPSRSSMFTGLYPMRNGAHANHSIINEGIKTLPAYLHDLGYRVVIAGKTHFGLRKNFPFEYLADSNIMPPGKNELLWTDLNTGAVEKLLAEHDKGTPLCLVVCSHSPHVYWLDNDGTFDPAKLKLPPYLFDTPETRRAMCKYLTDVKHMDQQLGDVLDSLAKHGYAENTLFMYTADQGAQFPFAKWNVYDAGIRVPLMIHWPGSLKPGTSGALVSLVDLLPTMIEVAGGEPPSDLDGKTLLPLLQGKSDRVHNEVFAAHTGDGRMNRSPQRCIRTAQFKLIENLASDAIYKTHISAAAGPDGKDYWDSWVRAADAGDGRAKELVDRYQHRPREEFYDCIADPYEQKNLIDDPRYAAQIGQLREKLNAWRVQQGEDLNKVPMPEDAQQGDVPYAK